MQVNLTHGYRRFCSLCKASVLILELLHWRRLRQMNLNCSQNCSLHWDDLFTASLKCGHPSLGPVKDFFGIAGIYKHHLGNVRNISKGQT